MGTVLEKLLGSSAYTYPSPQSIHPIAPIIHLIKFLLPHLCKNYAKMYARLIRHSLKLCSHNAILSRFYATFTKHGLPTQSLPLSMRMLHTRRTLFGRHSAKPDGGLMSSS